MSFRIFGALALATLVSTNAVAEPFPLNEGYLDLLARQANPSCHRDCGQTIISSQGGGSDYCTNTGWVEQLNRCLACANTLPDGYFAGITAATEACDFDVEVGGSVPMPDGAASTSSPTTSETGSTATPSTTESAAVAEVTNCHSHGTDPALYCQDEDNVEWEIVSDLGDGNAPESLTDCESGESGNTLQCVTADGTQVELSREGDVDDVHSDDGDDSETTSSGSATMSASAPPAAETGAQDSAASTLLPGITAILFGLVAVLLM